MKNLNSGMGSLVPLLIAGFIMLCGCDSGEKAIDEITGNRPVQQYHKSKRDIEKIKDRQNEKLKSLPDEEKEEGK